MINQTKTDNYSGTLLPIWFNSTFGRVLFEHQAKLEPNLIYGKLWNLILIKGDSSINLKSAHFQKLIGQNNGTMLKLFDSDFVSLFETLYPLYVVNNYKTANDVDNVQCHSFSDFDNLKQFLNSLSDFQEMSFVSQKNFKNDKRFKQLNHPLIKNEFTLYVDRISVNELNVAQIRTLLKIIIQIQTTP